MKRGTSRRRARPAADRNRHDLLIGLVNRPGGDTLDPFSDRADKVHYVDPGTGGVIAYRPRFGVALATGNPIIGSPLTAETNGSSLAARPGDAGGDPSPAGPGRVGGVTGPAAVEATLAGFLAHCRGRRLRPAVIGLDPGAAEAARRLGMHLIHVGDECLVRVEGFRLDVPALRNVRQAAKRATNFGVTTEVRRGADLGADEVAALAEVARLGREGAGEQGFSMSYSDASFGGRPECVLVLARDKGGGIAGFQRYAPCQGDRTLSLDVMRRRPGSPNGVNERMIVDLIAWCRENGVERLSLNFATFRDLMDRGDARKGHQRVAYWMVHRLDRWIQVESLYRFNAKFRPEWLGRWVALRSYRDLPWVLVAALKAEFGAGPHGEAQPGPG